MDVFLFTVEEVFNLKGLGTVLYPGISWNHSGPSIPLGQSIIVLRPNGQELKTTIRGFPNIRRTPSHRASAISLPTEIKAEDVPLGSQIWVAYDEDPLS
jgi:hypothetical protein